MSKGKISLRRREQFFQKLDSIRAELGVTDKDFKEAIDTNGLYCLCQEFAELIAGRNSSNLVFPTLVDYDFALWQSVKIAVKTGKFGVYRIDEAEMWKTLTSGNFPSGKSGKAQIDLTLIRFGGSEVGEEEIIKRANEKGLQLAGPYELLAFGRKYPDAFKYVNVVALGFWFNPPAGRKIALTLFTSTQGRFLQESSDDRWGSSGNVFHFGFLAFPK